MKACYFVSVLVLVFVARNGVTAQICETCLCEPRDAPVAVTCACQTPETVFELRPRDFNSNFKNTRNFTVSNCENNVAFKQNLFRELHNLDNLEINNVNHVVFEMGVFHTLNHLKLRNIGKLNFKSNAFHGGQLKSVEILQCDIETLPQYAFHDIDALEKFTLSDVHIANVQRNAIMLKNNDAVQFINVTIDKIESNAITIDADKVIILKSVLQEMNPNAINITAKNQFIISQTEFDANLPDNPIIAMTPIANISNNHFKFITPQIIKNIKGDSNGNILFINNTIDEIESPKPLNVPSDTWDLRGNQFNCSCEMLKLFENLKKSDILKNNYCMLSNCLVSLSHSEDKCARQSPASLDDTDLCQRVPTVAPLRPREGKVLGLTMRQESHDQFTTHMPIMRTTTSSSSTIEMVSVFLLWSFIALILF